MIADLPGPAVLAAVALVTVAGAVVQGTIGIGLALVAVPVLAIVTPELIPAGILVSVLPLVVLAAWRERGHLQPGAIGWALVGRVPGGVLGAALVAVLPLGGLRLLVAATVLAAVAVTWWADARRPVAQEAAPGSPAVSGVASPAVPGLSPPSARESPPARSSRALLLVAGAASGVTGTTAGIGGPPIAIAFRRSGGPAIRASLSAFFVVGSTFSLASLAVAGELTRAGVLGGLALVPFVILGYALAEPLRVRLPAESVRRVVLVFSGLSALALGVLVVLGR